jgi:hypothetical protein
VNFCQHEMRNSLYLSLSKSILIDTQHNFQANCVGNAHRQEFRRQLQSTKPSHGIPTEFPEPASA